MSNVFIQPGEALMIQTGDNSFTRLSFDEVILLVKQNQQDLQKQRKSSAGGILSRRSALVGNLIRKGKWSTGARADVKGAVDGLIAAFMNSADAESSSITDSAKQYLLEIHKSKKITIDQKAIIGDIIKGCSKCA